MNPAQTERLRVITSGQNALVKELRSAFHFGRPTGDGYCAIEGTRVMEEAIRSGLRFRAIFLRESTRERAERLLPQIGRKVEMVLLPDQIFDSVVATDTPQGVAALVKLKEHSLEDVLTRPDPLLVFAAGIQDPGNLGTIIRSAEAFGGMAALLGTGTVSRFNPKVIRASAGSVFRVPVLHVEPAEALAKMRAKTVRFLATSSHKGVPLAQTDLRGPSCLFLGSEGGGLPRELAKQMDETIVIPHSPRVESLNAAVAASIILYEASRQRNSAVASEA